MLCRDDEIVFTLRWCSHVSDNVRLLLKFAALLSKDDRQLQRNDRCRGSVMRRVWTLNVLSEPRRHNPRKLTVVGTASVNSLKRHNKLHRIKSYANLIATDTRNVIFDPSLGAQWTTAFDTSLVTDALMTNLTTMDMVVCIETGTILPVTLRSRPL